MTIYKINLRRVRRRGEPYSESKSIYVDSIELLTKAIKYFKRFESIEEINLLDNEEFNAEYQINDIE